MKPWIILFVLLISACSGGTAASRLNVSTPPPANADDNNSNSYRPAPYEYEKIDQVKRDELKANNKKFEVVPEEFNNVDFRNFKYPIARLKDGEEDTRNSRNAPLGGQSTTFDGVYYLDLLGDSKKEAVVFLYIVGCGVSCDGGASQIYIYSSQRGKPELLDSIEFGSRSSGCSLKTIRIEKKKIYVERFGRCAKSNYEKDRPYGCKFCVKDLTKTAYVFKRSELIVESNEIFETDETNVINYFSEISINE